MGLNGINSDNLHTYEFKYCVTLLSMSESVRFIWRLIKDFFLLLRCWLLSTCVGSLICGNVCPPLCAPLQTQEINQYQPHYPSARLHWWVSKVGWSEARSPEAVDQPPSDCSEGQRPKRAIRMSSLKDVCSGLLLDPLPPNRGRDPSVPHAPVRAPNLTAEEERVREHSYRLLCKTHFWDVATWKWSNDYFILINAVKRAL